MYSLNAAVPGSVGAKAGELARGLPDARARERGAHTLVVKRLGEGDAEDYYPLEARTREALAGTAPVAARIDRVECFEAVPSGVAPVVYLAVESPGLVDVHRRLCADFDPIPALEGDDFVPHVTVARGGSLPAARDVCGPIDPIEWTIEELCFFDAERDQVIGRVALPA